MSQNTLDTHTHCCYINYLVNTQCISSGLSLSSLRPGKHLSHSKTTETQDVQCLRTIHSINRDKYALYQDTQYNTPPHNLEYVLNELSCMQLSQANTLVLLTVNIGDAVLRQARRLSNGTHGESLLWRKGVQRALKAGRDLG